MPYNESSEWNEVNEMKCLVIFKKLEDEKFPRGKQMEYYLRVVYIEYGPTLSNYESNFFFHKVFDGGW